VFRIGVIDDRASLANAQRLPMACEIFASYEDAFEKLRPNASSYLVIVTRGHKDDMRVLRWAVGTQARYIGMIGSKRKVLSVYKALEKEGVPTEKFERVRAPVGLEIGALTPEEIAVSIAAELIAISSGVSAPISNPTGARTLSNFSVGTPSFSSALYTESTFRLLPIMPMYRAWFPTAQRR